MKKNYLLMLFFVCSFFSFAKNYTILIPSGLPHMALAEMVEEKKEIQGNSVQYVIPKGTDRVLIEMMNRRADFAVIPSNLAAQLYQKQKQYRILGSITSSSFYLLGRKGIFEMGELEGKKIYAFGKGLTPDIVLRTILKSHNMEKKVDIQYLSSPTEVLQLYLQDKDGFAFLTEPLVSQAEMKDKESKILFSMEEEWKKAFPKTTGFPQAVLVGKEELLGEEELLREVKKSIEDSIYFLKMNEERKEVLARAGYDFPASLWRKILERANIEWKEIVKERKNFEQYYEILYKENSNVIGGKLPKETIYAN